MTMNREKKREYAKQKNAEGRQAWLDTIEQGIKSNNVPWRKPWKGGASAMPINVKSKRAYRGGNIWGLWTRGMLEGWSDMRFGTRKNLIEAGYSVEGLKNGTGSYIVFYKPSSYTIENDDGEIEEKRRYLSRWYEVWNVEQCKDYKKPKSEQSSKSVPTHEMMEYFNTYAESQDSLTIKRGGGRAYYSSKKDMIGLPEHDAFTDSLGEVMTAFHEAAHSTGHGTRLGRPLGNGFGTSAYAFEELIAELTSMLTVLSLGGDYDPELVQEEHANNTAYLKHWLAACKEDDGQALALAFSSAQAATDYILDTLEEDE